MYEKLQTIINFFQDLIERRRLIYQLTSRDIRANYFATNLGVLWSFLTPLTWALCITFVFKFGIKGGSSPAPDISYSSWFITSIAAWNLTTTGLTKGVSVFLDFDYLVKKINFRISILPLVKLFSATFVHTLFLIIVTSIIVITDQTMSLYWFQLIYFIFAGFCLLLGLSWLLGSLNVFIPDISYFVGVLTQIGFWLTPIFWRIEQLPEWMQPYAKLNPAAYLVTGYRDSLLLHRPIWEHPLWSAYYWFITIVVMIFGILVFKKLRPHFADVI